MPQRTKILSRRDLKNMMHNDEDFVLVDVLQPDVFDNGHLPGAINIPADQLRTEAPARIPDHDRTVVVYCASPSCTASDGAADALADMGYTDVRDYRGGKQHWREGGFEVTREDPVAATA